jgi:Ca-activated chloride channel family protein
MEEEDEESAVAEAEPGESGQVEPIAYLAPDERSGHDIAVTVRINAGVEIEGITSSTHAVEVAQDTDEQAVVTLDELERIPNRDFVLRWTVAGDEVKSSLLAHRDERGGFFTMMLYPPQDLHRLRRQPVEMIFVLDCSGSMSGEPIDRAKAAVRRALESLERGDTFQVISFSDSASQLGSAPLPATTDNVRLGLEYVDALESDGGTTMMAGLEAALDFPPDPRRQRIVSFMTDGYIGNEMEVFAAVIERLGEARIFSYGIGTSVNRHLLAGLARLGRGAVAYIGPGDDIDEAVDLFYERVRRPALTDIEIEWGALQISEVYPPQVPDLFVGRPVVLTGRFQGPLPEWVEVYGWAGSREQRLVVDAGEAAESRSHPGIASVWARRQISHLSDRLAVEGPGELAPEILELALNFNLMSSYTSFVAVDSLTQTTGDAAATVTVPVTVPDGVTYGATLSGN